MKADDRWILERVTEGKTVYILLHPDMYSDSVKKWVLKALQNRGVPQSKLKNFTFHKSPTTPKKLVQFTDEQPIVKFVEGENEC